MIIDEVKAQITSNVFIDDDDVFLFLDKRSTMPHVIEALDMVMAERISELIRLSG